MTPDLKQDRQISWGAFGAAICIGLIVTWIFSVDNATEKRFEGAEKAWKKRHPRSAQMSFVEQIGQQEEANEKLAETINELKEQVGIKVSHPFSIPEKYKSENDAPFYFSKVYVSTRDLLARKANLRDINAYDDDLGYEDRTGRTFEYEQVREELIRLQLIAKAVMIALSTPRELEELEVIHGSIDNTGPETRPVLLREFVFTLQVRGGIRDVIWLLHELGNESPSLEVRSELARLHKAIERDASLRQHDLPNSEHFPFIVRGLRIDSENTSPIDQINQLDVTIELAGMEFIPEEERLALGNPSQRRTTNLRRSSSVGSGTVRRRNK